MSNSNFLFLNLMVRNKNMHCKALLFETMYVFIFSNKANDVAFDSKDTVAK